MDGCVVATCFILHIYLDDDRQPQAGEANRRENGLQGEIEKSQVEGMSGEGNTKRKLRCDVMLCIQCIMCSPRYFCVLPQISNGS